MDLKLFVFLKCFELIHILIFESSKSQQEEEEDDGDDNTSGDGGSGDDSSGGSNNSDGDQASGADDDQGSGADDEENSETMYNPSAEESRAKRKKRRKTFGNKTPRTKKARTEEDYPVTNNDNDEIDAADEKSKTADGSVEE